MKNPEKLAFKAGFSTWLTMILINESFWQLKKREVSINLNDDKMDNEIYHQHTIDVQTPVARMLNSSLEEAIARLPVKCRIVFVMREIGDMNVAEIQACLDISESNVKMRLNCAKALLEDFFSRFYKKEDIFHFHLSRCDRMIDQVMSKIT